MANEQNDWHTLLQKIPFSVNVNQEELFKKHMCPSAFETKQIIVTERMPTCAFKNWPFQLKNKTTDKTDL